MKKSVFIRKEIICSLISRRVGTVGLTMLCTGFWYTKESKYQRKLEVLMKHFVCRVVKI